MTVRELLTEGLNALHTQVYPQSVDKLLEYSEMLLKKNEVMNLTAITEPLEVATRHFLDCAVLVPYMAENQKVMDVGTGAGFPGMPLAILCPNTQFVLVDALRKRIDFLNEVIDALSLKNVQAVHARAEELAKDHRAEFDVGVSRAVADLRVLSELAMPFIKKNGMFLAMKAAECEEEVESAQDAIRILGGKCPEVIHYRVPMSDIPRGLVLIEKVNETPEKYPRRFAKINAAPLGGK